MYAAICGTLEDRMRRCARSFAGSPESLSNLNMVLTVPKSHIIT